MSVISEAGDAFFEMIFHEACDSRDPTFFSFVRAIFDKSSAILTASALPRGEQFECR